MQVLEVRCDGVDRRLGYAASVVAAASFAVLWVPNLGYRAANGASGAAYLALGAVLAGLVGAATLSGRRVLLAAALLLVAVGPWGPEHLYQVLYALVAVVTAARTALASKGLQNGRSLVAEASFVAEASCQSAADGASKGRRNVERELAERRKER
jgi:hypothetical protein